MESTQNGIFCRKKYYFQTLLTNRHILQDEVLIKEFITIFADDEYAPNANDFHIPSEFLATLAEVPVHVIKAQKKKSAKKTAREAKRKERDASGRGKRKRK